jgi:hypothetical protein
MKLFSLKVFVFQGAGDGRVLVVLTEGQRPDDISAYDRAIGCRYSGSEGCTESLTRARDKPESNLSLRHNYGLFLRSPSL